MEQLLTYKGKPLVRCGNILYYGDMSDKYVVQLTIQDSETIKDIKCAKKVLVQLLSTDTSLDIQKRVAKKSEKGGLYEAMDIADIWLHRALNDK